MGRRYQGAARLRDHVDDAFPASRRIRVRPAVAKKDRKARPLLPLHAAEEHGHRARNRSAYSILPELQALVAKTKSVGLQAFIVSSKGTPHTNESFGNWFRKAVRRAKLPLGCSPHGLRKAGMVELIRLGYSRCEIMALGPHDRKGVRPLRSRVSPGRGDESSMTIGWTGTLSAASETKTCRRGLISESSVSRKLPLRAAFSYAARERNKHISSQSFTPKSHTSLAQAGETQEYQ